MKPIQKIYWLRLALGIVAALACTGYAVAAHPSANSLDPYYLLNNISIALIVYILSYYILKPRFVDKVEKPQKLVTMGIGVYFLSWAVFWVLFYTIASTASIA